VATTSLRRLGSAPNDVWAVGAADTILHWDGGRWHSTKTLTAPSNTDLIGAWGSARDDVWAVGFAGKILHWDGSIWSPIPSGTSQTLHEVSGTSSQDAWAVGRAGTILHWNGKTWSPSRPELQ